jgi:hypothetical protein
MINIELETEWKRGALSWLLNSINHSQITEGSTHHCDFSSKNPSGRSGLSGCLAKQLGTNEERDLNPCVSQR